MNAPINGLVTGAGFQYPTQLFVTGIVLNLTGASDFALLLGGATIFSIQAGFAAMLYVPFEFRIPANTPVTNSGGGAATLLFKQGR